MPSISVLTPFAAAVCIVSPSASGEPPWVFSDLSFEEAKAATRGTEKILIVVSVAEWFEPTREWARTVWRDERIGDWIRANGLAVRLDANRDKGAAEALRIRDLVMMIAFKDGREFDRIGARDAEDTLKWLEAVRAGERQLDEYERAVQAAVASGRTVSVVQQRLRYAEALMNASEYEKALEEYLWLWEHARSEDLAMLGVGHGHLVEEMRSLVHKHEPAHEMFMALRDAATRRLRGDERTWDDFLDWIMLNDLIADVEATLAWFDRVKDDPDAAETIDAAAEYLVPLLAGRERWKDLTVVFRDPIGRLREHHAELPPVSRPRDDHRGVSGPEGAGGEAHDRASAFLDAMSGVAEEQWETFRRGAGRMYAIYLAAERTQDAQKIAAEALKFDNTPEMRIMLVQAALHVSLPTPEMRKWLDEAEKAGHDVKETREALEAALREPGPAPR